ncbi:Signal peptidase complex subunit 3 [Chytridiales sp. JEL 0842]|nr:Signal peptidase complex subunit 3 [Chytridiales sp. JEL 0842]
MSLSTVSSRANAVFAYFVTVIFTVLGLTAVTGPLMLYSAKPTVDITLNDVVVRQGRVGYYYDYNQPQRDLANITFNLEADLTPLFNWNTKQLFIYVVAEYDTKTHSPNQVVIWDDIIQTKDDALISLQGEAPEYLAYDIKPKIRGYKAKLSLHWNIVPHVGVLMTNQGGSASFTFPKA